MNLSPSSILIGESAGLARAESPALARQSERFAELVDRAGKGLGRDEIRQAAEQLVSATFIAPVLSQVRESSMAAPPFAPTPGERQFGTLLDQRVADEIVRSSRLPIVDRLTRDFMARAGLGAGQGPGAGQRLEVLA